MYASYQKWEEFYRRIEKKAESLIDPATGRVAASLVESIACPFCGSHAFRTRIVKHGFTYVTCTQCSFVYVNPQLTPEAVRNVYNDEDVREFFFRELLLPYVERDQKPEFERRIDELKRAVRNPNPRLLDVGCAAGLFLLLASQRGFEVEGLELNNSYVDYIKSHRPLKVQAKLLEEVHYPHASFDVVTLWDVLEHLPNPVGTLGEVARILKGNGVVAFTTINHNCINEKLLKAHWRYYMPPDHLCSFTPALLHSMLHRCGFTIVNLQHQYMFEVLADVYLPFLTPKGSSNAPANTLNKINKVLYLAFTLATQGIFNALHSGDLVTVYAKKN